MADTMGSTIRSLTSPTSSSLCLKGCISLEGSKDRRSPPSCTSDMKYTRERSAPDNARRGTRVSAGSSSPLHITTLPTGDLVPSGQRPPHVTVAANDMAMVVLPVPGEPPSTCILPAASQPSHSHATGSGRTSEPRTRSIVFVYGDAEPVNVYGVWLASHGAFAPVMDLRTASIPLTEARSLKSVTLFGRLGPKSGTASKAPTARAASAAFVTPGLPGVAASSSAQIIIFACANRSRIALATGSRLPALNATATAYPVAS